MKRTRPMVSLRLAIALVMLIGSRLQRVRHLCIAQEPGADQKRKRRSAGSRSKANGDPAGRLSLDCPPPVLDGKLDDRCWKRGPLSTISPRFGTKTPRPVRLPTWLG